MNDTNVSLRVAVGNSLYGIEASRTTYPANHGFEAETIQHAAVYTMVENGVLPLKPKKTVFATLEEGMAEFNRLAYGGELLNEEQASAMLFAAEPAPLPPMPQGMVEGTFAHTAWFMAVTGVMTGDEADEWKESAKMGEY